jgi:ubiquinone biosynthesis protein COQ9
MAKINQEDLIFKDIFGKIASDGWQSIDLEKLSHECDFDVLNVTGGIRNKIDLLVAFSAFIDTTVNQSIDVDLKDDQIPIRERLLEALLIRFEALAPYKAGVTKLMKTFPPNPTFVVIGSKSLKLSMEATLTAVGLEAKGIQGAIRVKGLCIIFMSGVCAWAKDNSEDLSATTRILDERLKQTENIISNLGLIDLKMV